MKFLFFFFRFFFVFTVFLVFNSFSFDLLCLRYRKAEYVKKKLIKRTLTRIHKKKVKEVHENMKKIFKLVKWIRNKRNFYEIYIFILINKHEEKVTNKTRKTTLLIERFFFKFSKIDFLNIKKYEYSKSIDFKNFVNYKIESAIKNVINNKISKNDKIQNRALALLIKITKLLDIFRQFFQISIDHDYCFQHFRKSITICFRKFDKNDYNVLKSYRSITLLFIIKKTLKSILINRLFWTTKTHDFFFHFHLNDRKDILSKTTIHVIMKLIHKIWAKKKTIIIKLMNESKAFDNVSHSHLHHNFHKRRIDENYLVRIENFVNDKQTKLRMLDYFTNYIRTITEISQDSTLFSILYLFYNADLLEILTNKTLNSMTIKYIDDVKIIVENEILEKNNRKLTTFHERVRDWARKHVSIFDLDKYQLIHFRDKLHTKNNDSNLNFSDFDKLIKVTKNCKYLDVILNKRLKFHKHFRNMKRKIIAKLNALQIFIDSTWKINMNDMRIIYRITILSLFLYCVTVWYIFFEKFDYKMQQKQTLKIFKDVQRRTTQIIEKIFKITSSVALNVKLHLKSINIILEYCFINTMFKMMTNRIYDEIFRIRSNTFSANFNINEQNSRFVQLNSFRKFEIRYQIICDQFLFRFEQRCAYVQSSWWLFIVIHIENDEKKKRKLSKLMITF